MIYRPIYTAQDLFDQPKDLDKLVVFSVAWGMKLILLNDPPRVQHVMFNYSASIIIFVRRHST